jgi:hypothetical protein
MFLFFGGCEIYQTRLAIANAKGAAQKWYLSWQFVLLK